MTSNKWPVKWTTKTEYVDIHTGEQLTKHQVIQKYTIIHTDKHATLNYNRTKGTRYFTYRCANRKLQELPFTD